MTVNRCALLAILLSTSAYAQWTPDQSSIYNKECVAFCETNADVTPSRRGECSAFCRCNLEETQRQFPNLAKLEREVAVEKLAPRIATYQMIINSCNIRIFGQPAGKLKTQ